MKSDEISMELPGSPAEGAAARTTAQVIRLGELDDAAGRRLADAAPAAQEENPLHAVRARLKVCVGEAEMTVGALLDAKEHQVVVLDRLLDQPVDLLLEGKVVARGHLVALDGKFALRISQLPLPLKA